MPVTISTTTCRAVAIDVMFVVTTVAVIREWEAAHGPGSGYQLIEPMDGFHPNQVEQLPSPSYSCRVVHTFSYLLYMYTCRSHSTCSKCMSTAWYMYGVCVWFMYGVCWWYMYGVCVWFMFSVRLQYAQALIGDYIWDYIQRFLPHYVGPENPNNEKIQQIFGDQGGY